MTVRRSDLGSVQGWGASGPSDDVEAAKPRETARATSMDDKHATQFCLALPATDGGTPRAPDAPRYLIMLGGGTPGSMVRLTGGTLWIGRKEDNELVLHDAGVSRRHAGLRLESDGSAWLTDLGSTNGTYHNGLRLRPKEPARVVDGDRIRVGTSIMMKFACPDPEEEDFQRRMFERTVRDPLTGLFNRVYFLEQLRVLARSSSRRGRGVAVIMLDIDHFKKVIDTFGHPFGDAVLRDVAARIGRCTRPEDLVARYGGEEFILALPVATAVSAMGRAEKIRRALAGRPVRVGDGELTVTASLGLACGPPEELRGGHRADRRRPTAACIRPSCPAETASIAGWIVIWVHPCTIAMGD